VSRPPDNEPWLLDLWSRFAAHPCSELATDDDVALWRTVILELFSDAEMICAASPTKEAVLVQIGVCSSWLRPHRTRWTAAGGFAFPKGYGDTARGESSAVPFRGLPTLDWSTYWLRVEKASWRHAPSPPGRRPLVLRVAVPARTARHQSTAIHTIWTPGSPRDPRTKVEQFYGFKREAHGWALVAHAGGEALYDEPSDGAVDEIAVQHEAAD